MVRLIIHADDFGLTEEVNTGIIEAHQKGILTSTSIMATGTAFEHAITKCRTVPTLDIGIHLTLVGEKSVLSRDRVKSLVDRDGKFCDHAGQFVSKYYRGQISFDDVRNELDAQMRRVVSYGVNVSHIDSHQHLHMLPRIFDIVVELAQKYNIKAIRFPCEKFRFTMLRELSLLPRIIQLLILNTFCHLAGTTGVLRTDSFGGFLFSGNLNKHNLLKIINNLPKQGTYEIMCHPGIQGVSESYNHWGYHWQDELCALLDNEVADILKNSVSLVSYHDIVQSQ